MDKAFYIHSEEQAAAPGSAPDHPCCRLQLIPVRVASLPWYPPWMALPYRDFCSREISK